MTNTAAIEQLILDRGPLSKPELARLTGLSLPTVSKLVDDLVTGGHIRPVGLVGKGAGVRGPTDRHYRQNPA